MILYTRIYVYDFSHRWDYSSFLLAFFFCVRSGDWAGKFIRTSEGDSFLFSRSSGDYRGDSTFLREIGADFRAEISHIFLDTPFSSLGL